MSTEIELWAGTHNGQTIVPLCIPLSVTPVLCLVAQLCPTLCDPMHEVPLSMGFSRQEYWNGLPFPPPGDLSDSGIESRAPALQANSLPS